MLLFLLSGLLLLRFADRQLLTLLFQLPPRITRFEPVGHHPKSMQHVSPPVLVARRRGERHQRLDPLPATEFGPPPGHPLAFISAELASKPQLAPPGQPQPPRRVAFLFLFVPVPHPLRSQASLVPRSASPAPL